MCLRGRSPGILCYQYSFTLLLGGSSMDSVLVCMSSCCMEEVLVFLFE